MKQVKIRVKKDTILSKKFAKKIKASYEDVKDKDKKKKKKKLGKEKPKFKVPNKKKKKDKGKKFKGHQVKHKAPEKVVVSTHISQIAVELGQLLKKDMEIKSKMAKLIQKLVK